MVPSTRQPLPQLKHLIDSFFHAVSFELGETPAYSRISSSFIPEGLLIRTNGSDPEVTTVSHFIDSRQALFESGELTWFRESELAETTEVFGHVAQRFSNYKKMGSRQGKSFEVEGMISTQFVMTSSGWKISSMAWDDERTDLDIPEKYRSLQFTQKQGGARY